MTITKANIITAIRTYVDGLKIGEEGVPDLKIALASPDKGPIEVRNETLDTGQAYASPGFTDALLEGIANAVNAEIESVIGGQEDRFVLTFGGEDSPLLGNQYLVPGFGTQVNFEIATPILASCTLTDARVRTLLAPGAAANSYFKVRRSGAQIFQLELLSDTQKTASWAGSEEFSAGQYVSVRYGFTGEMNGCGRAVVSLYFKVNP